MSGGWSYAQPFRAPCWSCPVQRCPVLSVLPRHGYISMAAERGQRQAMMQVLLGPPQRPVEDWWVHLGCRLASSGRFSSLGFHGKMDTNNNHTDHVGSPPRMAVYFVVHRAWSPRARALLEVTGPLAAMLLRPRASVSGDMIAARAHQPLSILPCEEAGKLWNASPPLFKCLSLRDYASAGSS